MPRPLSVRVLIANGAHARWVERVVDHPDPVTLGELEFTGYVPYSKPQSVSFESRGDGRRSAGERDDSAKRLDLFAEQIAEALNAQHAAGEFQRLILVAPPRLLRAIRRRLSPEVQHTIRQELAKDLTHASNHELRTWLHSPEML